MTAVDFFWDPVCPWAWLTSRWVHEVIPLRGLQVDWRFISLAIVNEERDYQKEFPAGPTPGHNRGLELLRVAAAARSAHGAEAVGPLYTAFGTAIHREGRAEDFDGPDRPGVAQALGSAGLPASLAEAATDSSWDKYIREDTETALARTGKNVGTPIITFGAPDGPSFFGPVISRVPAGEEAARLWDGVSALAYQPGFSELKRSLRERPQLT
jgi:2-hydroxychromene-2-carboxylate isomerase